MGSLFRGTKLIEQYEAFSVLAIGCRQLAQTCVTEGAKAMLSKLADELDGGVDERDLLEIVHSNVGAGPHLPVRCG